MSKFLKILLVCVICCQFGFIGAVGLGGGTGGDLVPVLRTTGLQTNMVEIARFDALWDAEGGSGPINDDRVGVIAQASLRIGDDWRYAFNDHSTWEHDPNTGRCEPTDVLQPTQAGYDLYYNFRNASTDALAIAMSAALEQAAGNTATADNLWAAARASVLFFTFMRDFGRSSNQIDDSNQCILDLGTAVPNVLEAAWLLEDAGYVGWTEADRLILAQWARDEVFYLVSWGVKSKKDHWGIITFNAALAIVAYGDSVDGFDNVVEWNGVNLGDIRTPTQYLNLADERLDAWLDSSGNSMGSQCQSSGQQYGLQSYGGFPDELRRTGGTNNCNETDLSFQCGDGQAECSDTSGAKFHQQKATNGLAHTCEILRRIDGNGARCFDLITHDNDPTTKQALYDAIAFSTTQLNAPGGLTYGTFHDYAVGQYNQGFKYTASTYYGDYCMYNAFDETATNVRGGRDYPYTRITHRDGVAHVGNISVSGDWSCATWNESLWQEFTEGTWDGSEWDHSEFGD